jgi:hypothetical protein
MQRFTSSSKKRGFIALFALSCLAAVIASTWRAHSQTMRVPQRGQEKKPVDRMIENLKRSGADFPAVELFHAQDASTSEITLRRAAAQDILSRGLTLDLDGQMALRLASGEIPAMTLKLPNPTGKGDSVELELTRVDIFAEGFTVITSSSNEQPVDYEKSAHYRGKVKGAPGSLAAISVLGNEVVGIYSTPDQGNFVLGRLGGDNPDNTHILYSAADLKRKDPPMETLPIWWR